MRLDLEVEGHQRAAVLHAHDLADRCAMDRVRAHGVLAGTAELEQGGWPLGTRHAVHVPADLEGRIGRECHGRPLGHGGRRDRDGQRSLVDGRQRWSSGRGEGRTRRLAQAACQRGREEHESPR